MSNEADTCRRYVVPKLQAAVWDNEPHAIREQVPLTDRPDRCHRQSPAGAHLFGQDATLVRVGSLPTTMAN